MISEIFDLN